MGMYTQLTLFVKFKSDAPKEFINTIGAIVDGKSAAVAKYAPDHPLFSTERWAWMLNSAGSFYFDAEPVTVWRHEKIGNQWCLTMVRDIKNYSGEWQRFIDYIAPFIDTQGYIGHYWYEEDERPTNLINEKGTIKWEWPDA
jgi:hypothetical protein